MVSVQKDIYMWHQNQYMGSRYIGVGTILGAPSLFLSSVGIAQERK